MQKFINYLAIVTFVALAVVIGLSYTTRPVVRFGAVPSTATTYNDLNLDSTNGIGAASLSQNGATVIASGTTGAYIYSQTSYMSTLNATSVAATTITAPTILGTTIVSAATLNATSSVLTPSITVNGGTAITGRSCATSSIGAITSLGTSTLALSVTSTDIALSGAVMGDLCSGSLTSATTSNVIVYCSITSNATATLYTENRAAATTTLAAGVGKVCYTH